MNIFDVELHALEAFLADAGEPSYRASQIWRGLYSHHYDSWDTFSSLPKQLRQKLKNSYTLPSLNIINSLFSSDHQTQKVLFQLEDLNYIESVLLRKDDRLTLCVSTQSGCPVGCVFCATGDLGLKRSLTSGEIVEQVVYFVRTLKPMDEKLTNIVLMGMGEPFLNYDQTIAAVDRLNDPSALNIGARRITISTIGITDRISQFAEKEWQINLSVSLHAPNDILRQKLVPISAKYPISYLISACHEYFDRTKRRITFEYVMIDNMNDSPELAQALADLLSGLNCHVNLIPLNPTHHFSGMPSDDAVIREFGRILISHNIATSIRESQGSDIQAGCGQLAARVNK